MYEIRVERTSEAESLVDLGRCFGGVADHEVGQRRYPSVPGHVENAFRLLQVDALFQYLQNLSIPRLDAVMDTRTSGGSQRIENFLVYGVDMRTDIPVYIELPIVDRLANVEDSVFSNRESVVVDKDLFDPRIAAQGHLLDDTLRAAVPELFPKVRSIAEDAPHWTPAASHHGGDRCLFCEHGVIPFLGN